MSQSEVAKHNANNAAYSALHTIALTVSYRGTAFSGFARQPEQLTVQGELETALETLLRRPVETVCAGRTDAGVHARRQVVSFDVCDDECIERSDEGMLRALNGLTRPDIAIRSFEHKPAGFSARFDAIAREYRYFFSISSTPPVLAHELSWHVGHQLNVAAMQEAAHYLLGEHDFKSFCKTASAQDKPTCRCIHELSFLQDDIAGESMLVMRIRGNAFLHSMVRTIAGSLVLVGHGKKDPAWIAQVLEARDRQAAGETAPACGLVLWEVRYR